MRKPKKSSGKSLSKNMKTLRDIPGMVGRYAATADGSIWSYPKKFGITHSRSHDGFWLRAWPTTNGYRKVNLRIDGKTQTRLVHRLVALAWIPNPGDRPHINHIDCDRTNNHIGNLAWCTAKENAQHSMKLGRFSEQTERRKKARTINADLMHAANSAKGRARENLVLAALKTTGGSPVTTTEISTACAIPRISANLYLRRLVKKDAAEVFRFKSIFYFRAAQ